MKFLLTIFNAIMRLTTAFIPSKRLRRLIRKEFLVSQLCPKGVKFYVIKNGKKVKQKFVKFGLNIEVYGSNNEIIIGENVIFSKAELVIRGNNTLLKIGKNTSVNNTKFRLYGNDRKITIGRDCMFSYNIEIWSGDGHAIFVNGQSIPCNLEKDVIIGDHVWLGAYTKILKGAVISNNSIVGMGSLVNKNFSESNVILSGIPAKIVKNNISWDSKSPDEFLQKNKF